ncbi:putative RNA-directed DNA polymerase [Rosa chinensis]|uniref:Putative RNA-directed DNA polymerase n=1 Tax=Rosa chinensis TaxID=74649 RepID=A0A2P6S1J0_ROSCH|nr:putative RNA-directed DNA polymerase [Rosa chinensis]
MNNNFNLSNLILSNFYNLIPVRLDNSNYVTWKFLLETMLKGCGLMKYVDGSFPCPSQYMITEEGGVSSEMTTEYYTWKQNDYAVMTLLSATLSSDVLSFVVGSNTSRELWCSLKERFASTSWFNKEQLKSNFYKLQKGSDSIDKYLDRVKIACDQLANVGIHMTDEDIIVSVLLGLPSDYTTMKTIIRAKHNPISTQELRSLLLIAEAELEEAAKTISLPSKTTMVTHADSFRDITNGIPQGHGTIQQSQLGLQQNKGYSQSFGGSNHQSQQQNAGVACSVPYAPDSTMMQNENFAQQHMSTMIS